MNITPIEKLRRGEYCKRLLLCQTEGRVVLDLSRHLDNWWDWFRTGWYHQGSRKKWVIKETIKQSSAFWLRILPPKSGWVGKALARRKGV